MLASLRVVIDRFQSPRGLRTVRPSFMRDTLPELMRANVALWNMDDDESILFLKSVLEACFGIFGITDAREQFLEELHEVFGNKLEIVIGGRFLFTLTADGRQFRCWYEKPAHSSHVESRDEGGLFEIVGDADGVKKYVDAIIPSRAKEKAVRLPNGIQFWDISSLDWGL